MNTDIDRKSHTYIDSDNNVVDILDTNEKLLSSLPENIVVNFKGRNAYVRLFVSKRIHKLSMIIGDDANISLGKNVGIGEALKIVLLKKKGSVLIGNNTFFGNCTIFCDEPNITFSIGENCLIGFGVTMRVGDGHTIYNMTDLSPINIPKDIKIAKHVWIGRDVVLLKGAQIPEDSGVGIRSVVTKSFEKKNCVYAGVPAKMVKQNINWSHSSVCDYLNELNKIKGQ